MLLVLSGAEQREVQERVAPGGGELRQGEDVGGVVPVPVQQRGARPGQEAHHRRLAGGVPELHLRRVLQEVLEQEPGPGALPRALQRPVVTTNELDRVQKLQTCASLPKLKLLAARCCSADILVV